MAGPLWSTSWKSKSWLCHLAVFPSLRIWPLLISSILEQVFGGGVEGKKGISMHFWNKGLQSFSATAEQLEWLWDLFVAVRGEFLWGMTLYYTAYIIIVMEFCIFVRTNVCLFSLLCSRVLFGVLKTLSTWISGSHRVVSQRSVKKLGSWFWIYKTSNKWQK